MRYLAFTITIIFLFKSQFISVKATSVSPNFIGSTLKEVKANTDYKVLVQSTGDLNNDGNDDLILILESNEEVLEKRCSDCDFEENNARIILVFLYAEKRYKVIIQNNKFIARHNEGDMSLYLKPEISIKNGFMTISYQYTRANQSYKFQFVDDKLIINSAFGSSVHAASGDYENQSYNFEDQDITVETGNISEGETNIKLLSFDVAPKSLSEFNEMYDWEILEYRHL